MYFHPVYYIHKLKVGPWNPILLILIEDATVILSIKHGKLYVHVEQTTWSVSKVCPKTNTAGLNMTKKRETKFLMKLRIEYAYK